ncbi:MAG TPA: DUF6272 family protein [Polyangiales bacterium]|nr:DUF6272 family protein [Polyangiales bacterium]
MEADSNSVDRMVQLRFRPLWLYVDEVRDFCGFFARATFAADTIGERVGLVVHELVENAIRYGDERDLELSLERSGDRISISVANTTSDDRAVGLRERLAELAAMSPEQAYTHAMEQSVMKPVTQSGLGLARIRYEGQCDIELQMSPGRVRVTARGVA